MAENTASKSMTPSNYEQVKALRGAKNIKFKECKHVKPSIRLRNYQVIGVGNFVLMKRLLLGDGAGLGKTLQVLAAYAKLKEREPTLKLLVITLKSTAKQWGKEVAKFLDDVSVHVISNDYKPVGSTRKITGIAARRAQYLEHKDKDIIVVGYSAISDEYDILRECRSHCKYMVVFDECQEFKNSKSKTWHGAYEVSKAADRVYGLSATPIKNRLSEFYCILSILVPGLLGKKSMFEEEFMVRELQTIHIKGKERKAWKVTGYKNLKRFVELIAPFFLARKSDEVSDELPKILSKKIELDMEVAQSRVYNDAKSGRVYTERLKEKYFIALDSMRNTEEPTDRQVDEFNALQERYEAIMTKDGKRSAKTASLMYCQMAANGPRWLDEEFTGVKEEEFERLVSEEMPDSKIIVYTNLESGIKYLSNICDKHKIKYVRITGAESSAQREKAQDLFQDKGSGVNIIFITRAGSAGVNLQTASVLLMYDMPWSYGDLYQLIGRAQRIGSEHATVLVIYMCVRGTIDEHVIDILEEKRDLIDQVMGDIAKGALTFGEMDRVVLGKGADSEDFLDELYNRIFG